jgi:tetratricopeptide (TPR) repeat protein
MTLSHSVASKFFTAVLAVFQFSIAGMPDVQAAAAEDKVEASKHSLESFRLMKAGEDDQALVEIDKAIDLGAGPVAIKRKAELLRDLGKFQEALVEAKKAVKLEPENADFHALLGSVLDALKLDAEALSEFNLAIAKRPLDRGFRAARSKIYERRHEYDKAVSDLTVAINNTATQNRSKFFERRGNCYSNLKDYPKAIADYTSALQRSYGRSELLRLRATAYDKVGNHDAAKKDLQAAGSMDEVFEPPSTLGQSK